MEKPWKYELEKIETGWLATAYWASRRKQFAVTTDYELSTWLANALSKGIQFLDNG